MYPYLSDLVVTDLKKKVPTSKTVTGRCYFHAKVEAGLIDLSEIEWTPSNKTRLDAREDLARAA